MLNLISKSIIALVAIILIGGCSESPVSNDAIEMDIATMMNRPSFSWFKDDYEKYKVKEEYIPQLKEAFKKGKHKILMFTSYSCNCGFNNQIISRFAKILDACDIDKENYELFLMSSVTNKHKYSNDSKLKIMQFPAIFFILDSNIDPIKYTSYIKDLNDPTKWELEKAFLEILKK